MNGTFVPGVDPPKEQWDSAWWFVFADRQLLIKIEGSYASVPRVRDLYEIGLMPVNTYYLGTLAGRECYTADVGHATIPSEGLIFHDLRSLYGSLDDDLFSLAGRAVQIVEWGRTHRYCGRCASPMARVTGERAMKCPDCGFISFPRLSPAVIVLVHHGNKLLLARSHNFPDSLYSILAGFVNRENRWKRRLHER